MNRELLQQALDALEWAGDLTQVAAEHRPLHSTIEAIRAELAKPQAEPVCWALPRGDGFVLDVICPDEHKRHEGGYTVPLYATPQAQPAPAVPDGVPDTSLVICPNCCTQFRAIPQDVQRLMIDAGFEPPFVAALAQPQAEPVLWVPPERDGEFHHDHSSVTGYRNRMAGWMPLYATPQQAQTAENPWKDAVLDRLASASIDAPTDEFPSRILDRIIEVEVMIALAHVPDGWVMVPKELFPSQRIAAIVAAIQASDSNLVCSADEVSAVYRAMIAASPAAPVVREPLSHKHLLELHAPLAVSLPSGWEWWARVIERAHGITGDRNG